MLYPACRFKRILLIRETKEEKEEENGVSAFFVHLFDYKLLYEIK